MLDNAYKIIAGKEVAERSKWSIISSDLSEYYEHPETINLGEAIFEKIKLRCGDTILEDNVYGLLDCGANLYGLIDDEIAERLKAKPSGIKYIRGVTGNLLEQKITVLQFVYRSVRGEGLFYVMERCLERFGTPVLIGRPLFDKENENLGGYYPIQPEKIIKWRIKSQLNYVPQAFTVDFNGVLRELKRHSVNEVAKVFGLNDKQMKTLLKFVRSTKYEEWVKENQESLTISDYQIKFGTPYAQITGIIDEFSEKLKKYPQLTPEDKRKIRKKSTELYERLNGLINDKQHELEATTSVYNVSPTNSHSRQCQTKNDLQGHNFLEGCIENHKYKCPECAKSDVEQNEHETVCASCGLVLSYSIVDDRYLTRESEKQRSIRSQQYVTQGDRIDFVGGLGTFIDYKNAKYLRDAYGNLLSPSKQNLYGRLKKTYSQFFRIKNHETEYRNFKVLRQISRYLKLNISIRADAAYWFLKVIKHEKKVINGVSLMATCIYHANKRENRKGVLRLREILKAFRLFGYRVSRKLILRDLMLYKKIFAIPTTPQKSESYIDQFVAAICNSVDLEIRIESKGLKDQFFLNASKNSDQKTPWTVIEYWNRLSANSKTILKYLTPWQRGGKDPATLAAATIYLADDIMSKQHGHKKAITQDLIAECVSRECLEDPVNVLSLRWMYSKLLKPLFKKYMKKSEDYIDKLVETICSSKEFEERIKSKKLTDQYYIGGSRKIAWSAKEYEWRLKNTSFSILKDLPAEKRKRRNPYILAAATIYLAELKMRKQHGHEKAITQALISKCVKRELNMDIKTDAIRAYYASVLKPCFEI